MVASGKPAEVLTEELLRRGFGDQGFALDAHPLSGAPRIHRRTKCGGDVEAADLVSLSIVQGNSLGKAVKIRHCPRNCWRREILSGARATVPQGMGRLISSSWQTGDLAVALSYSSHCDGQETLQMKSRLQNKHHPCFRNKNILVLLLLLTPFSNTVFSQGITGAAHVNIRVTDPQGASVPNAQVTLHTRDGRIRITSITDSDGACRFEQLSPGEYLIGPKRAASRAPPLTFCESSAMPTPHW